MVPFKKNDIIGQTMAMIGLGASIGIFYAWTVTINIKSEENVYQRMLWDHKWGLRPRGCSWVLPDEGNTKEHPFRAGPHFRPGA